MTREPLVIIAILVFNSCTTSKFLISEQRFQDVGQLKISEVSNYYLDHGFKDVSPDHLISIGEDIYPNSNQYSLTTPKTFEKKIKNLNYTAEHYFTAADGVIRVVLYEWNKAGLKDRKNEFQEKFDQMEKVLTEILGQPTQKEIQQKEFNEETFRDGIKWHGSNNRNAYLFMFGNDRCKYRQIRLAIYKD